ncbi:MAG: BtpA/SgcQ family protein [Anaerolineaceae bacterium]|nr:BtpA/SgcQ family protein [Anaerolineaceae bacterium]
MTKNRFENLFGNKKAIIGMIHLPALPGTEEGASARYDSLVDFALKELDTLQHGGVDGVIVENFWDLPYLPNEVPAVTVAALAGVAGQVIRKSNIPVGVNILYNSFHAEIAIARALDAAFVRAEVFTDPSLAETGIIQASAAELKRERSALHAENVAIFADVQGKNTSPLWQRPLLEAALDAQDRGRPDALIITGAGTGKPVSLEALTLIRPKIHLPIICGSGVNDKTVKSLLSVADAAIVGSFFKKDGKINQPTDLERVKALIAALR